jgi:hypothetical protein
MNVIAVIAAIVGALAGFGIVYASLKKANQGLAIVLGVLGAGIGAIAGVFLAIVVIALLIIAALVFLLPFIFSDW